MADDAFTLLMTARTHAEAMVVASVLRAHEIFVRIESTDDAWEVPVNEAFCSGTEVWVTTGDRARADAILKTARDAGVLMSEDDHDGPGSRDTGGRLRNDARDAPPASRRHGDPSA